MAKKRKTKKEKIILRLKRELKRQTAAPPTSRPIKSESKDSLSKEEKLARSPTKTKEAGEIKKDLLKSILLSLVAIGCLLLLYLA